MRTIAVAVSAVLLGVSVGVGWVWFEVATGSDHFVAAGRTPEQLWPRKDGDESKLEVLPSPGAKGQAKVVVVNGEKYNFGTMDVNTKEKHTFILKNEGDAPLAVQQGRTTCKCTISKLKSEELAVGDTMEITLEWTPKEYDENFIQTAEFRTSDPDRPIVLLQITGRVIPLIRAVPPQIVFTDISASESSTTTVGVVAYKHDELASKNIELTVTDNAEFFDVQVSEMPAIDAAKQFGGKSGLLLTVTVKPGLPLGPIHQNLRVLTSAHISDGLEIPIRGKVVGDIRFRGQPNLDAEHNLLDLGLIDSGAGRKATVHLLVKGVHRDDVQLSVGRDDLDPPDLLRAELGRPITIASGRARLIPLTIEIPANSRPINRFGPGADNLGRISIHTTHPTMPQIPLYIRFAIEG